MSEVSLNLVTAHTGSAHITPDDFREFNSAFIGESGVFPIGSAMAATQGSSNVIYIADGEGVIQGAHFRIEDGTQKEVTISNGDERYDLIVVHYHYDSSTKVATACLEVLEGTASGAPSYTAGNLRSGDSDARMPLYLVHYSGVAVDSIEAQFTVLPQLANLLNATNITRMKSVIKNPGGSLLVKLMTKDECSKVLGITLPSGRDAFHNCFSAVVTNGDYNAFHFDVTATRIDDTAVYALVDQKISTSVRFNIILVYQA